MEITKYDDIALGGCFENYRIIFARRAYCVGGSLKIVCVRPCVRPYDDDARSHQK